jgi:hypothetical protein
MIRRNVAADGAVRTSPNPEPRSQEIRQVRDHLGHLIEGPGTPRRGVVKTGHSSEKRQTSARLQRIMLV